MELQKLKLEKFKRIGIFNFPTSINLGIEPVTENIDVIIYYIDQLEDVEKFVNLANDKKLPKENRTIMIYTKGRKDGVNRDSIFMPFREKHSQFKLRAPMMCSISNELSACVMSFEGRK